MKDVLVSIVNGNRSGYIYPCVESICKNTKGIDYDIVVIDNCTGDPDLDRLKTMGVKTIINQRPLGFAANHTQVLSLLDKYRYLLIFNDDAFLENNVLGLMVELMNDSPDIAIAGPRIRDPDGLLQPTSASFPTLAYFVRNTLGLDMCEGQRYSTFFANSIDYSKTQDVDWLSGCCMMVRREFINDQGFLDTGYYMYLEDADLCRRAHNSGWRVRYMCEGIVTHHRGGSSTESSGTIKPLLFVEMHRSRLRFLRKTSLVQYLTYLIFINCVVPVRSIRRAIRGDVRGAAEVLRIAIRRPLL